MMSLTKLFSPSSIAIIGVSTDPKKVGYLVARNMIDQGYSGDLYFVHPEAETILGKEIYHAIEEIPGNIDLAILAVPASVAVDYLDALKEKKCRAAVLFAAGFKEIGTTQGSVLEEKLQEKIKELDLTVLGPNCLGFVNTAKKINATFLKTTVSKGNIGIISQSGALGSAMVDYFNAKTHIGLSYFISLGNKAQLDEVAALEFLLKDSKTEVIGMYLEDVVHGAAFQKALLQGSKQKPIIILKGGTTEEGAHAAMSHTGSLAGDHDTFRAAVYQSGAIMAESFAEFEMLLKLASLKAMPLNRNILVLSNAGGMGVLLSDELIKNNLHLVNISEHTKYELHKTFDEHKKITIHNPIDLLGDASAFDYEQAVNLTLEEKDLGGVIVLLTPQANTEIEKTADILIKKQKDFSVPIYPVFMGKESVAQAHNEFEKNGLASFRYFAPLPKALEKLVHYRERQKDIVQPELRPDFSVEQLSHQLEIQEILLASSRETYLNQYDSLQVIQKTGILTAKTYLVTSVKDLERVREQEGFPLVAKIASSKVTHKTEVKGVITGLNNYQEVLDAYLALQPFSDDKRSCYLQKEYPGHELIVGAKRDLVFGTVAIVGLGGVYAELISEVVQFVFPFSFEIFQKRLLETKLQKLTKKFRNRQGINIQTLYQVVYRIGQLIDQFEKIKEIDINPLMADGENLVAVDGRVILDS